MSKHLRLLVGLFLLTGCSYYCNWKGSTNGEDFIWKQVPQISFYTSILFWGSLLVYALLKKNKFWIGVISAIVILALLPVVMPHKLVIEKDKLTMNYPLYTLKRNKEIKLDRNILFYNYDRSHMNYVKYGHADQLGWNGFADYGIAIRNKDNEIRLPFGYYDYSPSILFLPFKYLCFINGFYVKLEDRTRLRDELKARLPKTDSIKLYRLSGIDYKINGMY